MSNRTNKNPLNAPGPFYVDESCTDCDLCREQAPAFFRRDDDRGYSYVWKQPETDAEKAHAKEALDGCPSESIGSDSE